MGCSLPGGHTKPRDGRVWVSQIAGKELDASPGVQSFVNRSCLHRFARWYRLSDYVVSRFLL